MGQTIARIIGVFLLLALLPASVGAASGVSETDGRYVRIILETRSDKAFADGIEWKAEWKYDTRGDGAVEEVSFQEYFDAAEKELSKDAPDGMIVLPDYPIPGGYVEFYFKGAAPGFVDLHITCGLPGERAPLADARFRIAVFSDMKMQVFKSLEKYDWGDLE